VNTLNCGGGRLVPQPGEAPHPIEGMCNERQATDNNQIKNAPIV